MDEDGYLYITGRKKNIIVTANGKNVFPEELETYLLRSPYVAECAVVGIMNERKRDYDVVALVYPDLTYAKEVLGVYANNRMVYEKISEEIKRINGYVQPYKHIDMLIMRDEEFLKNSSRKIKRAGLVEGVMDEYLLRRG